MMLTGATVSAFVACCVMLPIVASAQPSPSTVVTPAPESQFIPRARIQPKSDRTTITLINNTYASIMYQAVGDTQPRTLQGRTRVTLRGLRAPVTLTLDREDAGLLLVTPNPSPTSPETLEVLLDTTTDLGVDATTLRVERSGSVFLY
ncbi:hypothetical protein [Myxacorys almedinensis]|uniref:AMIN domain-containing protein n=1 Tax=Myxacorys almedinensis A TaxID=2690445 RepID=A0A8J7Z493_9CYAN|nr:hypothetical protein [Myxacorys almedinensis]NDJ17843.1 hypothetical protein [Myxacorys almedinensis A]